MQNNLFNHIFTRDVLRTLTQISWQRLTRGKPRTDNFYTISSHYGPRSVNGHDDRFRFIGSFTDKEGTLQLSNVTLMDEGTYTCVFTLFPSGIHETAIPLIVPGMIHSKCCSCCVCMYISIRRDLIENEQLFIYNKCATINLECAKSLGD
uniref:Immunoglobulin V-set domain-containing protein n=1 Tax=Labrus bergylta TaxID=56723 RepID=A0A3Q3EFJ9_9LABR